MPTTTMVSCANCGYQQEPAAKCRKCGSLFAYQGAGNATPHVASEQASVPAAVKPPMSPAAVVWEKPVGIFRRIYGVARWTTLGVLIVAIFLILHQAPPPLIDNDPRATLRLQAKLSALDAGFAPGMQHELRLDEAELNSFLRSNLALKREASASKPGGAAPRAQQGQPQFPAAGAPASAPAPAQENPAAAPENDPSIEEVQSSVRDVKIALADDRVQAYVLFDFHGKDLSLILEGRLHVQNGYLRFEPTGGKLGSLPLPQSTLESAVGRLFDAPENREKMRVPAEIRDIHIQNGELVVEYN
jgi:hypothetical protein